MGVKVKFKALPDAFWLSVGGAVVPVEIHAETLRLMPEVFGLAKAPHGKDEIEGAMVEVLRAGWGRARRTGNLLSIQVWKDGGAVLASLREVLSEHPLGIHAVVVETVDPPARTAYTKDAFLKG